jgi:peptide/nickel transport system substrate-binding protein
LTKTSITKLAAAACPLALALMSSTSERSRSPAAPVRFAVAEESRGLDPLTAHRRFSEAAIHVHDSLGLFDVSNKPFPALATEWSANADSTEYTIKPRDDVVFHDGSRFNTEAVKAHFSRVFDKQYCCNNGHQYMNPYTGTEIVDDKTIKVKFSKPWGSFGFYMGMLDVTGIPSNAAWAAKGMQMNREPVGAGPFKFVSWTPQSNIKLVRNPDYKWGSPMLPPYGRALPRWARGQVHRQPGDAGGLPGIRRLRHHQGPELADMRRLTANPAYQVVKIPQTGMPFSFVFNTARWPTDQLAVRKAINLRSTGRRSTGGLSRRAAPALLDARACDARVLARGAEVHHLQPGGRKEGARRCRREGWQRRRRAGDRRQAAGDRLSTSRQPRQQSQRRRAESIQSDSRPSASR